MQWNSAAEFFAMRGYGFYVWGSFGVSAALMLIEPLLAARRHRRAIESAAVAEDWKDAAR